MKRVGWCAFGVALLACTGRSQRSNGDGSAPRSGVPTAADLQGSWYEEVDWSAAEPPTSLRRRFDGNAYFEISQSPSLGTCGETGTFSVDGATLQMQPTRNAGDQACPVPAAHAETVGWTADGIKFQREGMASSWHPARKVPKIFATLELHDGNLASDQALPGANAMAKADAICNQSIARPDDQTYKALLVDGKLRSVSPAIDWVLRPDTTYFQADGVLNVVHTDAAGRFNPVPNNPIQGDDRLEELAYSWTGLGFDLGSRWTCAEWTSSDTNDVADVAEPTSLQFSLVSSVTVSCSNPSPFLCVSQDVVTPAGPDLAMPAAAPGDAPSAAELQGAWTARGDVATDAGTHATRHERLLFDGEHYVLVWSSDVAYCAEVGAFAVAAGAITFKVGHVEGAGRCVEGPSHSEPATRTSEGFQLVRDGGPVQFTHAPAVAKVFMTTTPHNGDFADDPSLSGTTPMDKADDFCNQSVAKPELGPYRALLWDGMARPAPPASGATRPGTTYYQADGSTPALMTDPDGTLHAIGPFVSDLGDWGGETWIGLGCRGWTSTGKDDTGFITSPGHVGLGGVEGECNYAGYAVLCVGEGAASTGAAP